MPMTSPSQHIQQDTIDRFLLGEMTPAEEREFRRLMQGDPELRDEVALMRRIVGALDRHASRMARMAEWDRQDASCRRSRIPAWVRYASVAASVALVTLLCDRLVMAPAHQPAPMHSLTSESYQSKVRGSLDKSASDIDRDLTDGRHEAELVLRSIDIALADTILEPDLRPEEEEYQRQLLDKRAYDLHWLRINALISAGRIADARAGLELFVAEEGPYKKDALALLRQFGPDLNE